MDNSMIGCIWYQMSSPVINNRPSLVIILLPLLLFLLLPLLLHVLLLLLLLLVIFCNWFPSAGLRSQGGRLNLSVIIVIKNRHQWKTYCSSKNTMIIKNAYLPKRILWLIFFSREIDKILPQSSISNDELFSFINSLDSNFVQKSWQTISDSKSDRKTQNHCPNNEANRMLF